MKRRLKINGVIIFLVILLLALFPNTFLRIQKPSIFDTASLVFGIIFILSGQLLRASSRGFKSENSQSGFALIQGGPYTLVRNPMYLGILLIGLGLVSVLFKWWVAVIFLVIFVIRYIVLIFKEEKKLLAAFSKDYQNYLSRVPRILPSIAVIAKTQIPEALPLKLSWVKKEIGTVLAVLLITVSLKSWIDSVNKGLLICVAEIAVMSSIVILFALLAMYLIKRTPAAGKDVSNKSKGTL